MAGLMVFNEEDRRIKTHQIDSCLKDALDRELKTIKNWFYSICSG